MPRVLAIAEAANPEWVSVPLVGWSMVQALSEQTELHLVSQIRNRDAILRAGLREGHEVTFIDNEAIAAPLSTLAHKLRMGSDKGWTTVAAINMLSYPAFERQVWQRFGPAIERGDYDIVHRITPLSPTTISSLAKKCSQAGVHFIMGPINGGVPWPKGFQAEQRREREWLSNFRNLYKLLPSRNQMLKHSAAILAGSYTTLSEIPERYHEKCFWLPENAVDPKRFNQVAEPYQGGNPLRASFIGRLVPLKGVDMLIEAAAPLMHAGKMTLEIIGDGPMRAALETQASEAGLEQKITFHGMVAHQEVQDILSGTHVMTFPSIREFGGGVVLEAMATGVVPMVVDYAGPSELVDEHVGYKVPIGARADIIQGFRSCLEDVVLNSEELQQKAQNARQRVLEHYTWAAKAAKITSVYRWLLDGGEPPSRIL